MKNRTNILASLFTGTALLFTVSCDVKKTESGSVPEVKVEGEAKLPKYDVDVADVKVGTKKVEVEVPTVDVKMPKAGTEGADGEKK